MMYRFGTFVTSLVNRKVIHSYEPEMPVSKMLNAIL